jgi:hypothetical protein
METITYREAAELLGLALNTVQHAAGHALTKVPSVSREKMLLKKQVELFKGKNQISLSRLKPSEREQWEHYRDVAEGKISPQVTQPKQTPSPAQQNKSLPRTYLDDLMDHLLKPSPYQDREEALRGHL